MPQNFPDSVLGPFVSDALTGLMPSSVGAADIDYKISLIALWQEEAAGIMKKMRWYILNLRA